ncbi:class I SAM-dependent methyltransferase [Cognatishimia activa]|uniref:Putative methyltransferase YcgJ n=1 Tax=Cognatishimia activa TaxID=1715691 RepID=A0A0N7MBP6_9RHOB|nr:class I SAM-dependent methyltransferase [Cognatishimia activa]CUJ06927.1 putative methyltransferase YcgJ [Cognatishimia activa]CUK25992.1 putative methyltransferase YcgJ [Cognatishimia activa]
MVNQEQFWDGIAPKYAKSPIKNMESYEYTLDRTRSYLKESDLVLEIGAGTGSTALLLADGVEQIVATDISEKMLAVGRTRAKEQGVENIRFQRTEADSLPEGPFDAVMAHNLLHLVEDLPGTLQACHEALSPGGLLISKTFVRPTKGLQLMYRFMRVVLPVMQWLGKAPYVAIYTVQEFEQAFERAGFEIIETANYPATEARRYIVARKR